MNETDLNEAVEQENLSDNPESQTIASDGDNPSISNESPSDNLDRPEFLPEEYWMDGKANLEKLSKDLLDAKERAEGLRKKLSKGEDIVEEKKDDSYETVFDDIELTEDQKSEAKQYADIAKKHGLTKAQAENLLKDISESASKEVEEFQTQTKAEIIDELGENAHQMIKGLESYANQQVSNGKWTEVEKKTFNEMVYNAASVRLMSEFLQNQKQSVNLAGMGQRSESGDWDSYYHEVNKAQQLINGGEREKGNSLRKEIDMKFKHLFN